MRAILGCLVLILSSPAAAATLTEAQSLYDRNQVAAARQAFSSIATDARAAVVDRAGAARALARIDWLVEADAAAALSHLDQARDFGDQPCLTATATARLLTESGRQPEALRRAESLRAACSGSKGGDLLRTWLLRAELDLAVGDPRGPGLAAAGREAAAFTPDAGVEAARARLELALLRDDSAGALAAWKDYFWLDDIDAPPAFAAEGVTQRFALGLRPGAAEAERLALADLLMRAGFDQASRRYAQGHGLPGAAAGSQVWKRLSAYWRERDRLDATLLRVNRDLAHDRKDEEALSKAYEAMTAALVAAADSPGDPQAILRRAYGLVGTVGRTSGYPSIHLGHVVEERDQTILQYGHTARIRFVALDNMIGNGFESWLWDGSASVGGWTANGVIVQVRSAYMKGPLSALNLAQGGDEFGTLAARQARLRATDIDALKARQVATLPGLADRLQLQVVDQIAAATRSRTPGEAAFRRAFLAEYARANLEQSMSVHEGRHAIDETLGLTGKVDQAVLEYRAKLSELALTAYPRMALRTMDRNLEGSGPHDRAGAKVFDGYRTWMEAHRESIVGYDAAVPLLEQLDRLTDGQIRAIASSLDPLANGETSPPAAL